MASVDILLSTYNGTRHLAEQLSSLLAQDCQDWRLLIRDDGSSDATPALLQTFCAAHPDQVRLLDSDGQNLRPCASFAALLAESTAEFVMFCDQDDIWLPSKVSRSLAKMREMTAAFGETTPLLAHSDLVVVDEQLQTIADSFWAYSGMHPENGGKLNRELVMNFVTGCAMIINRAAKALALPIPPEAIMHDWWIALVVAGLGQTRTLPEPLVLYRQHGFNTYGARQYSLTEMLRKLRERLLPTRQSREKRRQSLHIHYQQAAVFFKRFRERLPTAEQRLTRAYLSMYAWPPILRFFHLWRYGLWRSGLLRNLFFGVTIFERRICREIDEKTR